MSLYKLLAAACALSFGAATFGAVVPLTEELSLGRPPSALDGRTALVALEDDSFIALSFRPVPPFPTVPQQSSWSPVSQSFDGQDNGGEAVILGEPIMQPLIAADRGGEPGSGEPGGGEPGGERILAAWPDDATGQIRARLLDSTGQPIDEVFSVGGSTVAPISLSVSGHEAGFTVVWSTGVEIWLRSLDPDGEAITDPILLSSADLNAGSAPGPAAVASTPEGSLVVFGWRQPELSIQIGSVQALRVSAEGSVGDPVILMDSAGSSPFRPDVSRSSEGGFVAAWATDNQTPGGLWLQRFDPAGRGIGLPRRADPPTAFTQIDGLPSIDSGPGGAMVIAWEVLDPREPSAPPEVLVRAFDPLGHPMGAAVPFSATRGSKSDPHVAFSTAGRLVVTASILPRILIGIPEDFFYQAARRFAATCVPSKTAICLREGRFEVSVELRDDVAPEGRPAMAVPVTSDTGSFWFFSEDNIELLVKVLDGRPVNGHFWVMFGALSNVAYTVHVRDTTTGTEREFVNTQGRLASRAIVDAFPDDGSPPTVTAPVDPIGGGCPSAVFSLCLDGRFRASVQWRDPRSGRSGSARGFYLTRTSGAFSIFGRENLELMLKVLDGTASNGHFWVFVGGLTDVELDIAVEDVVTGNVYRHHKDPFKLESFADIEALPEAPISLRE